MTCTFQKPWHTENRILNQIQQLKPASVLVANDLTSVMLDHLFCSWISNELIMWCVVF